MAAAAEGDILEERPESILSGRLVEDLGSPVEGMKELFDPLRIMPCRAHQHVEATAEPH